MNGSILRKYLAMDIHRLTPIFRMVSYVLLFIIAVYLGKACVLSNRYFLFLILGGLFSLITFYNEKFAIYVILFSVSFLDILYVYTPIPRQLSWLPEIMIGVLTIKVLYIISRRHSIVRRSDIKTFKILLLLFVLLIFTGVFSGILNDSSPVITMIGFRNYFKYILLFFLLYYLGLEQDFYKKIIGFIFIIAAIQVPVSILEYTIFKAGDWAGGTFGYHSTGIMAVFVASIFSLVIGLSNFDKIKLKYWALCVLLFIPLAVGSARAGFLFIPLILTFHLFQKKRDIKTTLKYLILIILTIPLYYLLIYFISNFMKSNIVMYFQNPQLVFSENLGYFGSVEKIGRLSSIPYIFNFIKRDLLTFLFGIGPGNASPSFFSGFTGKYVSLPFWRTSFVRLLLEYGILGTSVYLSMFLYIYSRIDKLVDSTNDSYWKGIIMGFKGIIFLYLIATFYTEVFLTDILSFIFWFIAVAIFVLPINTNNQRSQD